MAENIQNVNSKMVEEDGNLHIVRTQELTDFFKENHHLQSESPNHHGDARWRLAGRIPFVVAEQWSRECGATIGSQEFLEYCKRKMMDGDFAKLRVRGV